MQIWNLQKSISRGLWQIGYISTKNETLFACSPNLMDRKEIIFKNTNFILSLHKRLRTFKFIQFLEPPNKKALNEMDVNNKLNFTCFTMKYFNCNHTSQVLYGIRKASYLLALGLKIQGWKVGVGNLPQPFWSFFSKETFEQCSLWYWCWVSCHFHSR